MKNSFCDATARDIAMIEKLGQSTSSSHKCRLRHDAVYLTDEQADTLHDDGWRLDYSQERYLPPLCKELCPQNISVGCAHDGRYRASMQVVLHLLASKGFKPDCCTDLIQKIDKISGEINTNSGFGLDRDMAVARKDGTSDGERRREEIADRHTELVEELIQINRETLQLYRDAVSAGECPPLE